MSHLQLMSRVNVELKQMSWLKHQEWFFTVGLFRNAQRVTQQITLDWKNGTFSWVAQWGEQHHMGSVQSGYDTVSGFIETLKPSAAAFLKLQRLTTLTAFPTEELIKDTQDAFDVMVDNLRMFTNPPTEPISPWNEGNPLSCKDAGEHLAEVELFEDEITVIPPSVEKAMDEAIANANAQVERFSAIVQKQNAIRSTVSFEVVSSLELLYRKHVEKEEDFTHEEFIAIISDALEGLVEQW